MTVRSQTSPVVSVADVPFLSPLDIIELGLPVPPSTNNLFMNLRAGKGRTKSLKYRQWITEAGWHVQMARQKPITGPVSVSIQVEENPRRDLDGYWKALLDLLVTHRLIEDDRNCTVRELHAVWGAIVGCRVVVRGAGLTGTGG